MFVFFSFLRPGWVDYSAAIRWATCRTSTCHLPLAPSWLWLELEFETTAGACKNVLQNAQEMHIKYLTDMPYNFFPAMWVTPPGWLIICFLFPSLECNNLSRLHLNGDNQQVLKKPNSQTTFLTNSNNNIMMNNRRVFEGKRQGNFSCSQQAQATHFNCQLLISRGFRKFKNICSKKLLKKIF